MRTLAPLWTPPSRGASLDLLPAFRKISLRPFFRYTHIRYVIVHRFQENIGGRPYLIEVRAVSDKWRAQLLRAPGIPAAMMPFYGGTPDEAAKHLTEWLLLAHRRRMASVETPS
jgi:hypothetical protein